MTDSQEDEPYDVRKPRRVPCKTLCEVYPDAVFWIDLKIVQEKGSAFWKTRSNASSFMTLYQPTVFKVKNIKTEEILHHKVSLWARPSLKIIMKDTWQVQREDSHQRGNNTVWSVAGKDGNLKLPSESKVFHMLQSRKQTIQYEWSADNEVKNHQNKDAFIADLHDNCTYNTFCEESKEIIHYCGNVECFELCKIPRKTQCS